MYSFQGTLYSSLAEVSSDYIQPFLDHQPLIETLRYENGKLLFFEEHYFRFMAAMRIMRMEIPLQFTMEYLQEIIFDLLAAKGEREKISMVKLKVVRSAAPNPKSPIPSTIFSISSTPIKHKFSHREEHLPIDLYKDHFIAAGLYSSLECAHQTWREMAWVYAHENKLCDGIILNQSKEIVETLSGSLFLVKGDQVKTPSLDQGCRKSVYRSQLIEGIQQLPDLDISEKSISPFALQKADEMFVLHDASEIVSIPRYRKKTFASQTTKHIVDSLIDKINALP